MFNRDEIARLLRNRKGKRGRWYAEKFGLLVNDRLTDIGKVIAEYDADLLHSASQWAVHICAMRDDGWAAVVSKMQPGKFVKPSGVNEDLGLPAGFAERVMSAYDAVWGLYYVMPCERFGDEYFVRRCWPIPFAYEVAAIYANGDVSKIAAWLKDEEARVRTKISSVPTASVASLLSASLKL